MEFMTFSSNYKWQKVTIYWYQWHYKWHCEQQRSQFIVMHDIMNNKKGHNIVNDKQLYS